MNGTPPTEAAIVKLSTTVAIIETADAAVAGVSNDAVSNIRYTVDATESLK